MKKTVGLIAAVMVIAVTAMVQAAFDDNIRTHIPTYIRASFTNNTADTSLGVAMIQTNKMYVMIPVEDINFLTDALAATNGSMKALVFGLSDTLFEAYDAIGVESNEATRQAISRTVRTVSGADLKFTHTIETDVDIGTTSTVTAE